MLKKENEKGYVVIRPNYPELYFRKKENAIEFCRNHIKKEFEKGSYYDGIRIWNEYADTEYNPISFEAVFNEFIKYDYCIEEDCWIEEIIWED